MNPRPLINAALLVVIVLCLFGSYSGWGWAIVALVATIALTRPWLPSDHVGLGAGRFTRSI